MYYLLLFLVIFNTSLSFAIEKEISGNIEGQLRNAWNNNAAVTSNTGKLYIKTPDSSSLLFNTNNSLTQFEVLNKNNAYSHVTVTGGELNGHSTISVANADSGADPVGLKIHPGSDTKYVDLGRNLRFGRVTRQTYNLGNGVAADGYITVQDVDGNLCRLLVLTIGS
jgi:hypothetical protein